MIDYQIGYYLPDRVRPRDVFAERSAVASDDLFPVECRQPERCLGDTKRIWLVTRDTDDGHHDPYNKLPAAPKKALKDHYRVASTTEVRGLHVSLLERVK